MNRSKWALLLIFVSLTCAGSALGQQPPPHPPPFVRATGSAKVTVKPDQAEIDIGVVSEAETAKAAAAANAEQSTHVLQQVRRILGSDAAIHTANYSVYPRYRPGDNGKQPEIAGFTANNTVHVAVTNLDKVGAVIDAATEKGANQIHGIQFTLRNEQAAREKALQQATQEARQNAQAMAAALGVKLGQVRSVEEQGAAPVQPLRGMSMAMEARAPTPVEPGSIEIPATVTITVEIAQP